MNSFCPDCGNILSKISESKSLHYKCSDCNRPVPVRPETSRTDGDNVRVADSTTEKHSNFIKTAPFDPLNIRKKKPCPKCGNAIVSMVRVTKNQIVVYACTCGYNWS